MAQEQNQRHLKVGGESSLTPAPWWLRFRTLEMALRPSWGSWIFFLGVVLFAGFMGSEAVRTIFISELGESLQVETVQRAVAWDPGNPEFHHRLAMILCDSFGDADRAEGLKQLRRAIELNPLAARYWSDLAWVCELSNDTACATQSMQQAIKLSPMTPQLHWVAANTFLRTGQRDAAMAEFRSLLELDPTYAPATFHVCLGSLGDSQLILQKVLPMRNEPRMKLEYLNFLITNEMPGQADKVWEQVVESKTPFAFPLATPYIEHLLAFGLDEEAQKAWRDLEKLGIIPNPDPDQEGNLVYNGDFEHTPFNAGLDWRNELGPSVNMDLSDPSAHSGKFCARVDFTVSRNEDRMLLYQFVPVAPSQAYLLTAYVRSRDITSDSGPRLEVLDAAHSTGPHVLSETTVGTTPWHQVSLKFCAGPETKLVRLSLGRERSRTFPTEITGSFWLDTVVLKAVGPASESACPASGH